MPFGRKSKGVLALLAVLIAVGAWQGVYFWFHYKFAIGSRTGIVRKLSIKGPPYCKYVSGEMAQQGMLPGQPVTLWEFTVSDKDSARLMPELKDAERSGKMITLEYRQDRLMWWRCTPIEYYVTALEK